MCSARLCSARRHGCVRADGDQQGGDDQLHDVRVAADDRRGDEADRRFVEREPSEHPRERDPDRPEHGARLHRHQLRGRHRAGHHPRRGRRHRRLHAAGLPRRHAQADPGEPEGEHPAARVGLGHVRPEDHRGADAPADVQRLRERRRAEGCRREAADDREPVDVDAVPRRGEEADRRTASSASAGASSPRPRSPSAWR